MAVLQLPRTLTPGMTDWDQTRGWLQARLLLRILQSPRQRGHGHGFRCHWTVVCTGLSRCCPGPQFPDLCIGPSSLFYLPPGLGVDMLFAWENPRHRKRSCGRDLLSRNVWGIGNFPLCRDKLGQVLEPK